MTALRRTRSFIWILLAPLGLSGFSFAEDRADVARALRRTPLVELIEKVSPSVVDIAVIKPGDGGPTLIAGTRYQTFPA